MINIPDHPDIECAERTGYPSWKEDKEEVIRCGECGRKIDPEEEDVYECRTHKTICLECLLMLHKKYIF